MMKSDHTEAKQNERVLLDSIRSKVILGFFLFGIALAVSFLVIRFTMREMINTVDQLSSPNYALALADNLFKRIVLLEQDKRVKALALGLPPETLIAGSTYIHQCLDTLEFMLYHNDRQLTRIDSMRRLLKEHDMIFLQYLKIRAEMSDDESLKKKSDELTALLMSQKTADSSVISHEQTTITTILFPKAEERELSFFERLFRGGREREPALPQPDRIVRTEENIKIDTVPKSGEDSVIIQEAVTLMNEIKTEQQSWNSQLVKKEYAMLTSLNDLIGNLLRLCHELQEDEMQQELGEIDRWTRILQKGLEKYVLFIFVFFLGSALIVFLILLDITKSAHYRRKLELAKEEAERLGNIKHRFLANMSHEIRTPLQSIIGFSEQMVKYPDQLTIKPANAIYQSSRHLMHVVNEVLDYSKLESEKFSLENKPFRIDVVMMEVIEVVKPQCQERGIEFRCGIDFGPLSNVFVTGDSFRVKQILFNLLGNAIKFTSDGFVALEMECEWAGDGVDLNLTISDSGLGIPKQDQERVFQLFEQVSQDGVPQDGIGLGLSIVQALVRAKGGSLSLLSEQGKGSRFHVKLHYPTVATPAPLSSNGAQHRFVPVRKVVMVDDDTFILELCRTIISRRGIRFDQYKSAEEFLASDWKHTNERQTLLIDVRLPGISGRELSERVRRSGAEVRLVAVTALLGFENIQSLKEAGFDAVLQKPFSEQDLMDILAGQGTEVRKTNGVGISPSTELLRLAENDPEQIREFLELYVADCTEDLLSMRTFLEKDDLISLTHHIHRLAGRCGQIGSLKWAEEFRTLEIRLRGNHTQAETSKKIENVLMRFEVYLGNLEKEVTDFVRF